MHLSGDFLNGDSKQFRGVQFSRDTIRIVDFQHPVVHMFTAFVEQPVRPDMQAVRTGNDACQVVNPPAADARRDTLGTRIVVLGVAFVGQHHVSRRVKGDTVQYRVNFHEVGIDIQHDALSRQLDSALPTMVVGIIAVELGFRDSVQPVVFRPKKETTALELALIVGDTHLPEVAGLVPAHVVVPGIFTHDKKKRI